MKIRKIKKQLKKAILRKSFEDWIVFKHCLYTPKFIYTLFNRYKLKFRECNIKFEKVTFNFATEPILINEKILYIAVEHCNTRPFRQNFYVFVFLLET